MFVEPHLAAEDPVDTDGVSQNHGHADAGNDQHGHQGF